MFDRRLLLLLALPLAACQAPPAAPSGAFHPMPAYLPAVRPPGIPPSSEPRTLPSQGELIADPARFTGLSGAEVTAILGAPSFQRRDADAEIWQYYGPASACVLDLFVYREGEELRVAHAELRNRSDTAQVGTACLADIVGKTPRP